MRQHLHLGATMLGDLHRLPQLRDDARQDAYRPHQFGPWDQQPLTSQQGFPAYGDDHHAGPALDAADRIGEELGNACHLGEVRRSKDQHGGLRRYRFAGWPRYHATYLYVSVCQNRDTLSSTFRHAQRSVEDRARKAAAATLESQHHVRTCVIAEHEIVTCPGMGRHQSRTAAADNEHQPAHSRTMLFRSLVRSLCRSCGAHHSTGSFHG